MLSRMIARSPNITASLFRALSTSSSLRICQWCLSLCVLSWRCLAASLLLRDRLAAKSSKSASNWSSCSLKEANVDVSHSWARWRSASSSSSSSPRARALVENALVFRSRSKSLNLCMSHSTRLRASSSLSLHSVWTALDDSQSRICTRNLCNLLIDFLSSSPILSFCCEDVACVAWSQWSANSLMPSSTFFNTLSISFCNFRAAAAVIRDTERRCWNADTAAEHTREGRNGLRPPVCEDR
mmetsp:Transcript_34763/g.100163  ORF Transcript_34763/g.100163 Transcript_34763/m.100163 type:complete len:241 (+) Transcript_34763:1854-2576(+)